LDILAGTFGSIIGAEKRSKHQVLTKLCFKIIVHFLTVMMKHGYTDKCEVIEDHRAEKATVNLTGRINEYGKTSPRFDVQLKDLEMWQNKLLSSLQFGFTVLTTLTVVMDHKEARQEAPSLRTPTP
jgi:small subunit ribosomal protein S15Ae